MSEYKRLTTKCEVGIGLTETSGNIVKDYEKVVNRLSELEDKIEIRKFVELKYKKGDYVFFISWLSGNVCEGTVIDWQEDSGYCIVCEDDMISAYECFSSKEAAEARLKELQEQQK